MHWVLFCTQCAILAHCVLANKPSLCNSRTLSCNSLTLICNSDLICNNQTICNSWTLSVIVKTVKVKRSLPNSFTIRFSELSLWDFPCWSRCWRRSLEDILNCSCDVDINASPSKIWSDLLTPFLWHEVGGSTTRSGFITNAFLINSPWWTD